jgi:transposase
MPQKTRVVGLDVAKNKLDACIRSTGRRLSASSTPEGRAELAAWLRANRVGRAVMEASGGYERARAEAMRAIGVEVLIVDPKRVRCFAKAAGRLAKNNPIDADTIAWFAETFPHGEAQPHDAARQEVDRLVQARTALRELEGRIAQQGEHRPPAIVAKALGAIAKTMRAELRKLEAAIAAKIKANPGFARRAEIVGSVPGLGDQTVAGVIAWLPELGRVSKPPPPSSAPRPTTTTAASAKASATSGADAASSAISFTCRSWAPPPSTTRCSRPITNAYAPGARKPRSL